MANRLALYGTLSTLGAASVIGSALHTRPNFYAAAVAVGRSSGALMVLANFALFNTICFGIVIKTIFFGRLRSIEYEHLFEKLWLFLTESLLALTIFRDDFSVPFAMMYGMLLFLKCFHWITADRVDYVPPPGPPTLFHIRCSTIIIGLTVIDFALVIYSLETIVVDGVSSMVLFASEFMILLASINGTSARYIVGLIDLRRARGREDAPSWEEKSMYLFYIDLAVDFAKLLTYLTFFLVILLNYGLPLHILRDVYMTLKSFLSRCSDLVRYRRATKDMDALYPNATNDDLTRSGDRTCIICREEMIPHQTPAERAAAVAAATEAGEPVPIPAEEGGPNETPKRLQCGHIFHFHCLRSWLERQQSCPTCRRDVLRTPAATRPGPRGVNGVNVQINPPPPAPGALPRANAPPGAPNPIQAVYDQYFRPPPPPADPTPAPTAPPHPHTTAPHSPQITRDQHIQRGIWGGPIAPGRFFATPLGAAPKWPPSTATQAGTAPIHMPRPIPATRSQGVHMPIIRLPEVEPEAGPSGSHSNPILDTTPTPASPDHDPPLSEAAHLPQSSTAGDQTPRSSNPPQIFAPSGVTSPSDEDTPDTIEPQDLRKMASEAALRRMTLRSRSAGRSSSPVQPLAEKGPSPLSRPHTPEPVEEDESTPITPPISPSANDVKGKGKAREEDSMEERATVNAYLTQPGSDLISSISGRPAGMRREIPIGGQPKTLAETHDALESRLKLLREVDEVVWGLVGELSRVKSGWEREADGDRDDPPV